MVSHEGAKTRRGRWSHTKSEQYFATAFAAPDGIAKLRELILTLAMQGKLVEQDLIHSSSFVPSCLRVRPIHRIDEQIGSTPNGQKAPGLAEVVTLCANEPDKWCGLNLSRWNRFSCCGWIRYDGIRFCLLWYEV
jgi:hypothetical protein